MGIFLISSADLAILMALKKDILKY